MTVQCKALGKRSKLGQHTKSFPREWSEFQNWCDYMEVPDLAVELWELQKGGEELRAALTHFDHEDIACGCGQCSQADVLAGLCTRPTVDLKAETKHLPHRSSSSGNPPPRPTQTATSRAANESPYLYSDTSGRSSMASRRAATPLQPDRTAPRVAAVGFGGRAIRAP